MWIKEIKHFWLLIMAFFLYACSSSSSEFNKYDARNTSHLKTLIHDTIENWLSKHLAITTSFEFHSWQLDPCIVFNSDSTLIYVTINNKLIGHKNSVVDVISDLGGAKINDKWYFFFRNVSMPVERALYQDSIYAPYTFEELSYIAHRHRYPQVVDWHDDGNYTVKEAYFAKVFLDQIRKRCNVNQDLKSCVDSVVIQLHKDYYKYKIDPIELKEIQEAMNRSVQPPEPEIELTVLEKIFGRKKKLFETKEWKNRNNKWNIEFEK